MADVENVLNPLSGVGSGDTISLKARRNQGPDSEIIWDNTNGEWAVSDDYGRKAISGERGVEVKSSDFTVAAADEDKTFITDLGDGQKITVTLPDSFPEGRGIRISNPSDGFVEFSGNALSTRLQNKAANNEFFASLKYVNGAWTAPGLSDLQLNAGKTSFNGFVEVDKLPNSDTNYSDNGRSANNGVYVPSDNSLWYAILSSGGYSDVTFARYDFDTEQHTHEISGDGNITFQQSGYIGTQIPVKFYNGFVWSLHIPTSSDPANARIIKIAPDGSSVTTDPVPQTVVDQLSSSFAIASWSENSLEEIGKLYFPTFGASIVSYDFDAEMWNFEFNYSDAGISNTYLWSSLYVPSTDELWANWYSSDVYIFNRNASLGKLEYQETYNFFSQSDQTNDTYANDLYYDDANDRVVSFEGWKEFNSVSDNVVYFNTDGTLESETDIGSKFPVPVTNGYYNPHQVYEVPGTSVAVFKYALDNPSTEQYIVYYDYEAEEVIYYSGVGNFSVDGGSELTSYDDTSGAYLIGVSDEYDAFVSTTDQDDVITVEQLDMADTFSATETVKNTPFFSNGFDLQGSINSDNRITLNPEETVALSSVLSNNPSQGGDVMLRDGSTRLFELDDGSNPSVAARYEGEGAFTFGKRTGFVGFGSIVLGAGQSSDTPLEAGGSGALAFGEGSVSSGRGSIAMGDSVEASENDTTAFGLNTTASGSVSTAFGINTIASDEQSFVAGKDNEVSGRHSFSTGESNTVSGWNSVAIGDVITIDGFESSAFGYDHNVSASRSGAFAGERAEVGAVSSATVAGVGLETIWSHNTVVGINNNNNPGVPSGYDAQNVRVGDGIIDEHRLFTVGGGGFTNAFYVTYGAGTFVKDGLTIERDTSSGFDYRPALEIQSSGDLYPHVSVTDSGNNTLFKSGPTAPDIRQKPEISTTGDVAGSGSSNVKYAVVAEDSIGNKSLISPPTDVILIDDSLLNESNYVSVSFDVEFDTADTYVLLKDLGDDGNWERVDSIENSFPGGVGSYTLFDEGQATTPFTEATENETGEAEITNKLRVRSPKGSAEISLRNSGSSTDLVSTGGDFTIGNEEFGSQVFITTSAGSSTYGVVIENTGYTISPLAPAPPDNPSRTGPFISSDTYFNVARIGDLQIRESQDTDNVILQNGSDADALQIGDITTPVYLEVDVTADHIGIGSRSEAGAWADGIVDINASSRIKGNVRVVSRTDSSTIDYPGDPGDLTIVDGDLSIETGTAFTGTLDINDYEFATASRNLTLSTPPQEEGRFEVADVLAPEILDVAGFVWDEFGGDLVVTNPSGNEVVRYLPSGAVSFANGIEASYPLVTEADDFGPFVDSESTASATVDSITGYSLDANGTAALSVIGTADGSGGLSALEVLVETGTNLNLSGRIARTRRATRNLITSDVSTNSEDYYIGVDTSTGAYTITLSSADAQDGREFVIHDQAGNASGNSITIDTEGSETISGAQYGTDLASVLLTTDNESITLRSDGTNWYIV